MTSNQDKVYFSKAFDPTNWNDEDTDYMTFFLVPRKWWSIKAWKFANSLRSHMLSKLTRLIK
jgi:hypothetical protein